MWSCMQAVRPHVTLCSMWYEIDDKCEAPPPPDEHEPSQYKADGRLPIKWTP